MSAPFALLGNGSIPVGAGEPFSNVTSTFTPSVYPRGCGGTKGKPNYGGRMMGLSPRVRGSNVAKASLASVTGLSPRVRGNLGVCPSNTVGEL